MGVNSGGVPITQVSVYDGNTQVDNLNFLPAALTGYAMKNGFHHVTVNMWDANGKLYQAKSSFTVTGFGQGACEAGSGTITLCSPSQGSYVPEGSTLVSAAFAPGVKSWNIAVDGKSQLNSGVGGLSATGPLLTTVQAPAGNHTLTVRAVDSTGVTRTVKRSFSTFYNLDCNAKAGTCRPGITITNPSDISEGTAGDESTSFVLQAEVVGNPKPTTKMIVYLDGVKEGQSAGPEITATLKPTKGSHYVVVLAWDTTGILYETYGNVDIQ
jgi:hypothetical protein